MSGPLLGRDPLWFNSCKRLPPVSDRLVFAFWVLLTENKPYDHHKPCDKPCLGVAALKITLFALFFNGYKNCVNPQKSVMVHESDVYNYLIIVKMRLHTVSR